MCGVKLLLNYALSFLVANSNKLNIHIFKRTITIAGIYLQQNTIFSIQYKQVKTCITHSEN